jgi:O-antigen/teichoic acid export membrane protein
MAFSIPTLAFMQLVSSTFIGFKELRYHSIIQYVALPLLMIMLAAIALIAGWGLAAWIRMYVLSLLGTSLLALWFLRTRIRPVLSKISGSPVSLHEMVSYAWPMSIAGLIVLFLGQVNTLLLGYFQAVEEVGIYRIYWSLALIMTVVQESLGRIYKPTVSVHAAKHDIAAIREIYHRTTKWTILINVFVAGLFSILGRPIIALFFAPEYTIYFTAFLIMIGGQLTNSIFGYQGRTLEALSSVRLLLLNNLIRLVLNVGLALLIIPLFGIYGAAIATAFATITVNVISYLEIRILYKIKLFDREYLRALAGVLAITAISFLAKSLLDLFRDDAWNIVLACAFMLAQILFISKYATDVIDKQILHTIWLRVRSLLKKS